jgi:hypothetical protein
MATLGWLTDVSSALAPSAATDLQRVPMTPTEFVEDGAGGIPRQTCKQINEFK